jgi:tetratricopeptide (TPR) repeat protein
MLFDEGRIQVRVNIRIATLGLIILVGAVAESHPQGPGGEIVRRPPVNEAAAARAESALRSHSRTASTSDQLELAIKRGNMALDSITNFTWVMGAGAGDLSEREKRLLTQAESNYQRATKLNPKDWRGFSALGNLYWELRRCADAVTAYEEAAALRPKDAHLQIALGDAYRCNSKALDAIRAYSRSIELDPTLKNEFAYSRLASQYESAEMLDEAIHTYRQLQAIKPAESFYWMIGLLYEKQKKYEQALDAYKSQVKLYPNDPNRGDVYEKSGHIYRMFGRYPEAVNSYKNQLRLSPKKISILMMLGETYLDIGDIAAAGETQKELAMVEGEQKYGNEYNRLLMEHIELAGQIEQLRQAIHANPRDADKHFRMGNAYLGWKGYILGSGGGLSFDHHQESIKHYKEAILLEPNWDGAHFNLGLAYFYSGNKSAAITEYQTLKQLRSSFAEELLKVIR